VAEEDQPITISDLMANEFVKMIPASNTPPLTAKVVEVETPGSEVEFDVFDNRGHHVDDGNVHDVNAAVTLTGSKNKVVTLHTSSSGNFRVANVPSGQAKVVVTRVDSGTTSKAANLVKVKAKATKNVRIVLKPVKH